MKTFEQCCEEVAGKNGLGNTLVTGHKFSYFKDAAELYAEEKVKEERDAIISAIRSIEEAPYLKNRKP